MQIILIWSIKVVFANEEFETTIASRGGKKAQKNVASRKKTKTFELSG